MWAEAVLTRVVLNRPGRVARSLEAIARSGRLEEVPTTSQVAAGVLRMIYRLLFRPETIGLSGSHGVRTGWRAKLFQYRPIRFPFLWWEGSVAPFDLSGLAGGPDRIQRHVLGTHHDGAQFIYDLEILSHFPGALEALRDEAHAIVHRDDRRSRWLRDLVVYEGYHEHLLAVLEDVLANGIALTDAQAADPDLSFEAYMRWCAAQPDSLVDTLQALRRGELDLGSMGDLEPLTSQPDAREPFGLGGARRAELAERYASGFAVNPDLVNGYAYRGVSLGLPKWVDGLLWKTFQKSFVHDPDLDLSRGWNLRLKQTGIDGPLVAKQRRGRPWTFGHFRVERHRGDLPGTPEGALVLDYGFGERGPLGRLVDGVVALHPDDPTRLLGRSYLAVGGRRVGTPSYFTLSRDREVEEVVPPTFGRKSA